MIRSACKTYWKRTGSHVEVKTYLALLLPPLVYSFSVLVCLALYGGYTKAEIFSNPQCRDPRFIPLQVHQDWGANFGNLSAALHISDIHVNDIDKGKARRNLADFLKLELPHWANLSEALIITGDLVNAKLPKTRLSKYTTRQVEHEWKNLSRIASAVNQSLHWLPIFGNHDTFGGTGDFQCLYGGRASENHVCKDRPGNETSTRVYRHRVAADVNSFSPSLNLVGFDATPQIALHGPLNFFGDLRPEITAQLDNVLRDIQSEDGPQSNVIIFSHYPTSILRGGTALAQLARPAEHVLSRPRFAANLNGHLHTCRGVAPSGLQSVTKSGYLELELPDMMVTRRYRVLLFDHGVFSFHDRPVRTKKTIDSAPQIFVTNPPSADICTPGAGAAALLSSHIRFFVLSANAGLLHKQITVFVGEEYVGKAIPSDCSRLPASASDKIRAQCHSFFMVPWNPKSFDDCETHVLRILLDGKQIHSYEFALGGCKRPGNGTLTKKIISAMFSLSRFDVILETLTKVSLSFCLLLSICALCMGEKRIRIISAWLCVYGIIILLGPAIISSSLNEHSELAYVGFFNMYIEGLSLPPTTDMHLVGADPILWFSYLPLAYITFLSSIGCSVLSTYSGTLFAILPVWSSIAWVRAVFSAYGLSAIMFSPTCVPFTVFMILSLRCLRREALVVDYEKKKE